MTRVFFVSLSLLIGCGDSSEGKGGKKATGSSTYTGDAAIEAVPMSLAFLPDTIGTSQQDFVTIRNVGGAALTVSGVTFENEAFILFDEWDETFELGPGELRYVDIVHTVTDIEDVGTMTVHSSDPVTPDLVVDLTGYGLIPRLKITPENFDFGEVEIPCFVETDILLENVGTADLTITGYDFVVSTDELMFDELTAFGVPTVIEAGESVSMTVDYLPVNVDPAVVGTLTIQSDDPQGDRIAEVTASSVYADMYSETFPMPELPSVDLLFLIDNSCSMEGDNRSDINQGIPLLLNELQVVSNWQMIEVTDQSGCSNVPILDGTTVDAAQQLIDNAFASVDFAWSEALLSLASTSLALTGIGDCNSGFLRPGALLYIIVASDEYEQSGVSHLTWIQDFQNYVPRPDMVTISSIVDVHSSCGDGTGPGGYLEAANATEGTVLDICSPAWGGELSNIADTLAAAPPVYLLPVNTLASSLVVTLDGVETTDYEFDLATRVLTLFDPAYVKDFSSLTVDYALASACIP